MRGGDREQPCCAEQPPGLDYGTHRHRGAPAVTALRGRLFLGRKLEAHASALRIVRFVGLSKPGCAVRSVSTKPNEANLRWLPVNSTRVCNSMTGLPARMAWVSAAVSSWR